MPASTVEVDYDYFSGRSIRMTVEDAAKLGAVRTAIKSAASPAEIRKLLSTAMKLRAI